MACKETQDQLDNLELLVILEHLVHQVLQVQEVILALLGHLVIMAHPVRLESEEIQVQMGLKAQLDHKGQKVPQEYLVPLVQLEQLDQ